MVAIGIDPRWVARCPTCRSSFCLNDVIPVQAVASGGTSGLGLAKAAAVKTSGPVIYTVGHGRTESEESSGSDDDEVELAARAGRRALDVAADASTLAAWVDKLSRGGEGADGGAVRFGGLIDVRSELELETMPESTHRCVL